MDFRTKNPNISFWRHPPDGFKRDAYPFEGPNVSTICEFVSPDKSTVFLCIFGSSHEDENFNISFHQYLIEAPRSCPMRQAFEIGEISWEDFWHHKGWLIEASSPSIFGDGYYVRYVHPSQMTADTVDFITKLSDKSPIQHKYESLCRQREWNCLSITFAKQLEELEQKYSDILVAA